MRLLHIRYGCLILLIAIFSFAFAACHSWGHFWETPASSAGSNGGGAAGTLTTIRFADTGQTTCYNASASQACGDLVNFPYQDADFANIPAARSFTGPTQHPTYTSDYTTADNVTGLVWRTCSEGLSGAACATGTAGAFTLSPDTATPQCLSLNAANGGAGRPL
ncbi:MAG: hypothetical protein JSR44_06010 [Spirochaetes bacterium]|nr:hypothetical protein [Spirochaetota bacterium]